MTLINRHTRVLASLAFLLWACQLPVSAQQQPGEEARFGVITDFELHFAQFGGGGGFSSDIVLTNPSTFFSASGSIDFFDANGLPLAIELVDDEVEGPVSSVNFELPPSGGLRLRTDSSGPVTLGSASLSSGDQVGGVIRFRIPNVGIAGVPASLPLEGAIVPFRQQDGVRTALAVRSLAEAGNLIVSLTLRDFDGEELQGGFFALGLQPNARISMFIDEIFDELDLSGFEGVVVMEAEGPFAATALELGDDAGEFTTLPVTPLPDIILLKKTIAEMRRQMSQGDR